MKRTLGILIVLTLLRAEGPAIGGYAVAFSQIGSNARSAALAGALVADINSGFLAFTNPASLVHVQGRELGLSLMTLPLLATVAHCRGPLLPSSGPILHHIWLECKRAHAQQAVAIARHLW